MSHATLADALDHLMLIVFCLMAAPVIAVLGAVDRKV